MPSQPSFFPAAASRTEERRIRISGTSQNKAFEDALRGCWTHKGQPWCWAGPGSGRRSGLGQSQPTFARECSPGLDGLHTSNDSRLLQPEGSSLLLVLLGSRAQREFQMHNKNSFSLQIFSTIHVLGTYICTILVTCSKLFYSHYIVGWDHLQPQKKGCHPALHEETEAQTGPGFQGPSWWQSQDLRPHLRQARGLASFHGMLS